MKIKQISLLHGLVLLGINLLATTLGSSFISQIFMETELFMILTDYLSKKIFLNLVIKTIPFLLPCILITLITKHYQKSNEQQLKKFLVNIPFVLSLLGISGWISGYLINLYFVIYMKFTNGIPILNTFISMSFVYIFLTIFTFMGSFFVLETINRKYILPSLIPEGHISKIKGIVKPSITLIYILLYITLCLFPCFILSMNAFNNSSSYKTSILMIIIFLLNLLLTIVISRFYSKPLLRLKDCAKDIANGNYDIQTGIITGDELGVLSDTFNDMAISLKEKEIMYETFGKVVTPEIRNWLLQGNTNLGGEIVCATILFCDIRGFTSISEQIKPEQVVSLLNKYFSTMEQCIVEHNGIINKYIGDAIMAIFGVPVPNENQALDAYKCSIDMKKRLIELNKELEAENLPSIKFGIGLHTGNVLAGNIGSNSRMEYTVIGDTVNVASRIESLCKEYNCDLLISETTAEGIIAYDGNSSKLQSIGETQIRGRKTAISIFKG